MTSDDLRLVDNFHSIAGGRAGYWEDQGYEWLRRDLKFYRLREDPRHKNQVPNGL